MKGKKKNKSNVQECNSCNEELKTNEPIEKDEDITTEDSEQEDEEKENKED